MVVHGESGNGQVLVSPQACGINLSIYLAIERGAADEETETHRGGRGGEGESKGEGSLNA